MASETSSLNQPKASEPVGETTTQSLVLVDGHVHLHPGFDLAYVLDSAAENFRDNARQLGLGDQVHGCLLLTESVGVSRFDELLGLAGRMLGRWSIRAEAWNAALVAECSREPTIVLVAGRQVVTCEGLEVLAIGCREHFGEGKLFESVITQCRAMARVCIVPWGFGKWTANRGALVRQLLSSPVAGSIYLGDNGGRLQNAARPALFNTAAEHNIPILPGTDPFPFGSHAGRVGSYGFVLRGDVHPDNLGLSVMNLIAKGREQPAEFGCRSGALEFVGNQLAMQIRKRLFKR